MKRPIYDSAADRIPLLTEIRDVFRFRDLLFVMTINMVKTRYRRSLLGILWSLLNPLLNMVVLTVAFSSLFRSSISHYPVYILTGLVFWNFLAQSTTFAMNAAVWGSGIIKRVYLPRTIFALAAIGNGLINLVLSLVPLVVIVVVVGHTLYLTWWAVPFAVVLLAAFALGIALLVSTMAVYFADVVEFYQVLLQAAFFITPIAYPASILPEQTQRFIRLNPIYTLLEIFRQPIFDGVIPGGSTWVVATLITMLTLLLGIFVFTQKSREFAYQV